MLRLYLTPFILLLVVVGAPCAQPTDAAQFPRFRHVDKAALGPEPTLPKTLTLLADQDFAPFSFTTADNKLTGISVQLGLAVCAELKVQCVVKPLSFADLLPALQQKQGDVILGGPQVSAKSEPALQATRPYYFSYSQFAARSGANFAGVDAKSLAGRRLGFVQGTGQAAFLKSYYDRANLVPFSSEEAMFESLRTGGLDLVFADSMRLAFWAKGDLAHGCCVPFGAAFADKASFTHSLVMIMRPEDVSLRQSFDVALDKLQEKGASAKIFAAFLPSSPF